MSSATIDKTSYRVMKTGEFERAVFYRASCDCIDPDHDVSLEISADDFPSMSLIFTAQYEHSVYWGSLNWLERQLKRITGALRLLFLGRLTVEYEYVIINDDHIDSFISAIQDGRKIMHNKNT